MGGVLLVVSAVKILRLILVGGGVPRIAFGGVTFGIGLLRAHLTDLLFVLVLMLKLVFVVVSLLGLVFVVVLMSVCRPCCPETRRKRRIGDKINRISLKIRGSLGFGVRGGGWGSQIGRGEGGCPRDTP